MAKIIADNVELIAGLDNAGIEVIPAAEFAKVSQEELEQHELFDNINDGQTSAFKVYRKHGLGTDKATGRSFDYIVFNDADADTGRANGMVFKSYFEPTLEGVKEFIDSWSI